MVKKITSCVAMLICVLGVASGLTQAAGNNAFTYEPIGTGPVGSTFLEEEAGICAYTLVLNPDLNLAEAGYKSVEKKTENYIIGSVSLDDYGYRETDDVHVYADINGWVIAYYLNGEHPSKIIDWISYRSSGSIAGSKIELALEKVCAYMYVAVEEIKYYDFRYTRATNMMIVVDEEFSNRATETFRVKVPSNHPVFSATWSLYVVDQGNGAAVGQLKIDQDLLHSGTSISWDIWDGPITPIQISPNVFHEISIYNTCSGFDCGSGDSYGAVMLIYSEPL